MLFEARFDYEFGERVMNSLSRIADSLEKLAAIDDSKEDYRQEVAFIMADYIRYYKDPDTLYEDDRQYLLGLADKFIGSEYDTPSKDLCDCIQDFVNDNDIRWGKGKS